MKNNISDQFPAQPLLAFFPAVGSATYSFLYRVAHAARSTWDISNVSPHNITIIHSFKALTSAEPVGLMGRGEGWGKDGQQPRPVSPLLKGLVSWVCQ